MNHKESFCQEAKCFVFEYVALPFGLSSSCKAFNDLISSLVGFWRRCPLPDGPVRVSSYIDDISAVTSSFDATIMLSIRMVYEVATLGLSLEIPKCSLFPLHAMKSLGSIIHLTTFEFRVSKSRVEKIRTSADELMHSVQCSLGNVPAKLVAKFVGLVWSSANCCHRTASVMLRGIMSVLTREMRSQLWSAQGLPINLVINQFWSGCEMESSRARTTVVLDKC